MKTLIIYSLLVSSALAGCTSSTHRSQYGDALLPEGQDSATCCSGKACCDGKCRQGCCSSKSCCGGEAGTACKLGAAKGAASQDVHTGHDH